MKGILSVQDDIPLFSPLLAQRKFYSICSTYPAPLWKSTAPTLNAKGILWLSTIMSLFPHCWHNENFTGCAVPTRNVKRVQYLPWMWRESCDYPRWCPPPLPTAGTAKILRHLQYLPGMWKSTAPTLNAKGILWLSTIMSLFPHCWHSENFTGCAVPTRNVKRVQYLPWMWRESCDCPRWCPPLLSTAGTGKILPGVGYRYPECEKSPVPTLNVKRILWLSTMMSPSSPHCWHRENSTACAIPTRNVKTEKSAVTTLNVKGILWLSTMMSPSSPHCWHSENSAAWQMSHALSYKTLTWS